VGEVVVVVSASAGLAIIARIVMKRRHDFMFTSKLNMHTINLLAESQGRDNFK